MIDQKCDKMNRKLIRIYQKCVDKNGVSFVLIKNLHVEDATTDIKLNLFLLFICPELENRLGFAKSIL